MYNLIYNIYSKYETTTTEAPSWAEGDQDPAAAGPRSQQLSPDVSELLPETAELYELEVGAEGE